MKGLLFTPEMSKSAKSGDKTMTRRLMKEKGKFPLGIARDIFYEKENHWYGENPTNLEGKFVVFDDDSHVEAGSPNIECCHIEFPVDNKLSMTFSGFKRRSKLFMPKWAARKFYRIVSIKVEKLQNISFQDAVAEGVEKTSPISSLPRYKDYGDLKIFKGRGYFNNPIDSFRSLWDSINKKVLWSENPDVIVYEFRKCNGSTEELNEYFKKHDTSDLTKEATIIKIAKKGFDDYPVPKKPKK